MALKYPLPLEDKGFIYENGGKREIFSRQIWRGDFDEFVRDVFN